MSKKIVLTLNMLVLALAFAACTTRPTTVNPATMSAAEAEHNQLVADVVATLGEQPAQAPTHLRSPLPPMLWLVSRPYPIL